MCFAIFTDLTDNLDRHLQTFSYVLCRYKESLTVHQKSLNIKIKALGTRRHSVVAASLLNIGAVLVMQGR